jgi:DNA excision repair protein ERCC-4
MYFLQGLPSVGPVLARSLLEKFASLENIVLAGEDELREIDGLGKSKAKQIRAFLGTDFS